MSKQLDNPDHALAASCRALMSQETLPPYELNRLFDDLRVRHMIGDLIVRAAGGPIA